MLLFSALFIGNSIHKEGVIYHVSQKPQAHIIKPALETVLQQASYSTLELLCACVLTMFTCTYSILDLFLECSGYVAHM